MPRISIKSVNSMVHYFNTINYVAKGDKCSQPMIGACNAYLPMMKHDIVPAIREQFDTAREFYGKKECRPGIHFEINFSPEELKYLDRKKILECGYWISETQFTGCMTYFAVHDHSEYMHLDMLINPINIYTGNMYGCNRSGWNAIMNSFIDHLKVYILDEKIISRQIAFPN